VEGNRWATARGAVTAQLGQFFENFRTGTAVTRRRYLEVAHEFEQIVLGYFTAGLPRGQPVA
jgi:hypothetical protein